MEHARRAVHRLQVGHKWLTRSDHRRLTLIRDKQERAQRAATYIALRLIVATLAGAQAALRPMLRRRGRAPYLLGSPVVFNLSHSEGKALIGVARRGRIGVDMEVMRSVPMSERNRARIVEASREISSGRVLSYQSDRDVLQGWTRLESFSKATGRGINRTLADFGIRAQQNPRWHTQGATIAEKATRQLPGFCVRDLAPRSHLIAAVARSQICR